MTRGLLTTEQADAAVNDLLSFPIRVFPTTPLLQWVWELRDHLSANDALLRRAAEATGAVLLSADQRLANAPGIRCTVELL